MNTVNANRRSLCCAMLALAVMLAAPFAANAAGVKGSIRKKNSAQWQTGTIRWLAQSRSYSITMGTTEVPVPVDQVAEVKAEKPASLDGAVSQVQKGGYAGAIATLEQIAKDYAMLEHDVTATRYLAECYVKMNQPDKAITVVEKIIRDNPGEAVKAGDMAYFYWDALLKKQEYAKLEQSLTVFIQKGSRDVAAVAQLKRGDMQKQKGNVKDALVDGYLRTVYFFQGAKAIQAEALYKTVKCFEELNRINDAERWRKKLLTEFPGDQYSERVKSGS